MTRGHQPRTLEGARFGKRLEVDFLEWHWTLAVLNESRIPAEPL
jgi:hypothetical protein